MEPLLSVSALAGIAHLAPSPLLSVSWLVSLTRPRPPSWPWFSLLSPRILDLTQPLGETSLSSHSLPLGHPDPRRGSWESETLVSPNHRGRQSRPVEAMASPPVPGGARPCVLSARLVRCALGPRMEDTPAQAWDTCPARGS